MSIFLKYLILASQAINKKNLKRKKNIMERVLMIELGILFAYD